MRQVFLDASFYIALIDPRDTLHTRAREILDLLLKERVRFVTVDVIVYEILAFFSNEGEYLRAAAARVAREILTEPTLDCIRVDTSLLRLAIERYEQRPDKRFSLTDCVSMLVCEDLGITDVLTSDRDFERAGFLRLLVP